MRQNWLAGEDVEGVPVLRAAVGVPVSFGLLQAEDVQAVEQRLGLVPGMEGQVRVIGPGVTGAEQLTGEDPARGKRPADPCPQGRELQRRTERRAEPGMDQVRGRQVRLRERRAQNGIRPAAASGMRARSNASPAGSASTARTSQPRASNSSASVPSPQPRSIARRSWPAPSYLLMTTLSALCFPASAKVS
jgi:hypothetical protein